MRPSVDQYFMGIAVAASQRATCNRRKVGAVIVGSGRVISTGYNEAPRGQPHCLDVDCEVEHGHCVRCVHAEANALIQAGRGAGGTAESTIYTTASPCRGCASLILNAGISRVVFSERYTGEHWTWMVGALRRGGVELVEVSE